MSANSERLAGAQDALELALHGPTFELDWTVVVAGVEIACHYWNGPVGNSERICLNIPLAHPELVNGRDCSSYVNGEEQDATYWVDYPEDDNPDNPKNFWTAKGRGLHSPVTPFEVWWVPGQIGRCGGKPRNSPFSIRDENLDKLCLYEQYHDWTNDAGKTVHSGPFTVLKAEVCHQIIASWQEQLALRNGTVN